MAPINPNNTPRFKFNYTQNGFEHSFQIRSHASPATVGTLVDGFLTALFPAITLLTLGVCEFAASASDIFLPVTMGQEGEVYGSGFNVNPIANWFYGFQGRSAGGRKWHLDIYGATTLGTDFRLLPGENTDVDAAVAFLQASTGIVGIDDDAVTVYSYVNCGVNAHWQRAVRP
jgi:hypothetical protein